MEAERDENRLNREHLEQLKKLEIQFETAKAQGELELKKLEAKWSSWLSLPKYIIKLPVLILLGIGYIIHAVRKTNPEASFWEFIKR